MTSSTFVIAEMACSHDGNPEFAKQIIDAAIIAGADAIQFQIWRFSDIVVPNHKDIDLLQKIELSHEKWKELYRYTRKKSQTIEIIACVYDRYSADFAFKLGVDAFKIHTSDLSNHDLLNFIGSFDKRIDLSIGSSSIDEITSAINTIRTTGNSNIWLMFGKQLFPTKIEDSEILYGKNIGNFFKLPIGYQDHSDAETNEAFYLPLVAIGCGYRIIEKHITHDRLLKCADYHSALNPEEFKDFLAQVRRADSALGDGLFHGFSEADIRYRKYSKKFLVASRRIEKNCILETKDFSVMRTNELGISPDKITDLVGRKINRTLEPYEIFSEDLFD